MTLTEEARANEQLHHRVREKEDHSNVDNSRDTQRKGEALNTTHRKQVEDDGCNQVDRVGDQNRTLGSIPAFFNRCAQRATIAYLVADSLKIDDEGVGGHADCHDQTRNTGQREAVAHRPREQCNNQVGNDRGDDERAGGDDGQASILPDQVDDDQQEANQRSP